MPGKQLLSIVVPVFNETEVVEACYERLTKVARSLPSFVYELLFVDDGSSDDTYAKLQAIAKRDANVRALKFSRNFGHQTAITAGVDHARGDCIVVIDADLQDPPEVIPEMIEKWREGYDVV
ncbi:MAG: glycosyltransferase, partial [Gemmatimonadales bacterium]|nr:glycosyltransferase [Gemmatimonadales bacterium]